MRYAFLLRASYSKQLCYVMKPIVNRTCVIMVLLLNAFLVVSIDPKFYNWYIFVLMLWCHWVTPQWTMYVISHWFLFVYIMPFYVFYHIMFLCFRCWCTLSEMTRIKMINHLKIRQSYIYNGNSYTRKNCIHTETWLSERVSNAGETVLSLWLELL